MIAPGIGALARADPKATAVSTPEVSLSFGELDLRQRRVAGLLRAYGLRRGDRVAVWSDNRPEVLDVTIGALRAGFVPVPVHASLTEAEAAAVVTDSGASLLFSDRGLDRVPTKVQLSFGDELDDALARARPAEIADHALGRPMHYTSGTTGIPKGVWCPRQSAAEAAARSCEFAALWGLRRGDVHLVCSPLSHSAPLRFCLRTLEAGGSVIVPPRFDAAATLETLLALDVTSTFMVPTHLERLLSLGDEVRSLACSGVRLLAHAGAPMREATKRSVMEVFPRDSVWEFYGATEGQATRISAREWLRRPGSVGRATKGARVLVMPEESEAVLPPGHLGEVWVRDSRAERFAYWKDPLKTAEAWRDDAFFLGDIGRLDDDGYLFLEGRKGDWIISGGVNVPLREVEAALGRHPSVVEALVYGAPSDEWGQEVRALVVAAPGRTPTPQELRGWLRRWLAAPKCPRVIELVAELPRTETGKLKRPGFVP